MKHESLLLLLTFPVLSTSFDAANLSRRGCIASIFTGTIAVVQPREAKSSDELPIQLRRFTKLAPLGRAESSTEKTRNLSLDEISKRLENAILNGATGKGGYFLSGDVPSDIFRDDCLFVDPTNSVQSLSQYKKALSVLFDPETSYVSIVDPFIINKQDRTLSVKIRSRGFIKFFWKPYITAYEASILYTVDDDGLIQRQEQTWSKPALKALQESFTPTINTPPPLSTRPTPGDEPKEATQLFQMVNGRRPLEYSWEELTEIKSLVQRLVDRHDRWRPEYLPGKWMLVYLEPGPNGAGVDRRIPFPDLGFNDSFQIFTKDSVTNIGELLGPPLYVEVSGVIQEVDDRALDMPKRYTADINGGKLCVGESCLGLPIQGEGLFDALFINDRIRVLQNLNGGGARGVQVKL